MTWEPKDAQWRVIRINPMVFPAIDRPIQNQTDIRIDYHWLLTVPDRPMGTKTVTADWWLPNNCVMLSASNDAIRSYDDSGNTNQGRKTKFKHILEIRKQRTRKKEQAKWLHPFSVSASHVHTNKEMYIQTRTYSWTHVFLGASHVDTNKDIFGNTVSKCITCKYKQGRTRKYTCF